MTDSIFNRIQVEIKRTYYIYDRYKSASTFILVYHEDPLSVEQLAVYVRISDKFVRIDDNHYFINLAFTSQEDSIRASQNLLLYLDNFFNNKKSCIAIDTFNPSNSAQVVLDKLMQILKKDSYNRIKDESILKVNTKKKKFISFFKKKSK